MSAPTPIRLDGVIASVNRLAELLAAENEALVEHQADASRQLHDRKVGLARVYEQHMLALAQNPELLAQAGPELTAELNEAVRRLAGLIERNATLLKAAIEANQRLLKAVFEAAKDSRAAGTNYTRGGTIELGNGPANALSFNQTL